MTRIAQADPQACVRAHRREIDSAIRRVMASGRYILGREVEAFEREFAKFVGARRAVGVGTGTDALALALRASGVGAGKAVYTVSHTSVATIAAIELAGGTPVLVDVEPRTLTMDPEALDRVVRLRLRGLAPGAVIPVHLYGGMADMEALLRIARRRGLPVIEDSAQAHGASRGRHRAGSSGRVGCFSFYPTKNLGALGDAGAVTCNDASLAERLRELRQYGWTRPQFSRFPGMNTRLDELQAAVLRVKLRHLARDNERRRNAGRAYDDGLGDGPWTLPTAPRDSHPVYHQYVIRLARREALRRGLERAGIGTAIHYPVPVHRQPAYRKRILVPGGALPETDRAVRRILSLPMHGHLSTAAVRRVIRVMREWAAGGRD